MNKMVYETVKLVDSGWTVEIDAEERSKTYKILKIHALFGHGIYMPIDTSDFTQEQWDIFHIRVEAARN